MEETIKQIRSGSRKEFEKLLSQDLNTRKFKEGEITTGVVREVGKKFIFLDLGLKSEGAIPIEEFKLTKEIDKIKIGSKIDVLLERVENKFGDVVVSREKARMMLSWNKMEKAFENKEEVKGIIISRCKGGMIVDVESCLCFLPGSQIDLKPLKNFDHLMKVPQTFECVKLDKKRGNIVLSRRAVMEKIRDEDRNKIISKIEDSRFVYLGKRLIYQNDPKALPTKEYKQIHSDIAKKILNPEETRFTTLPIAEKLIDDIRAEKDISAEKLDYMNEIDQYLKQMRQTYEKVL